MVAEVMAEDRHPQDYLTQHKPASHYWRITLYNQEREYVKADILEVDKNNSLVFKRTTIFDVALNRATEYIVNHSVSCDQWESVTECDKNGVPLWEFECAGPVDGEDPESEPTLETLLLLIEATNKAITAYNERAIRKTEE